MVFGFLWSKVAVCVDYGGESVAKSGYSPKLA
jgi:hypothetical protein